MIAPITVDALLSAAEPILSRTGRIVTGLRINGVDQPAFREPDVLALDLLATDDVDLVTTPVGDLATQALDDAIRFLPELGDQARALARGLRGADVAPHCAGIGGLADNLALMAALVHTADLWARQAGLAGHDWLGEDIVAVEQAAGAIERATVNEDWVRASDALERDMAAALDAWGGRLAAGRAQVLALGQLVTV
ncbi:MAG: hypothetical protein IT182_09260 [Acidobacteria bacterium]|nr:hypothetical protein [Acidobacteriota bacterium]